MKANDLLTKEDWERVEANCASYPHQILMEAVYADRAQTGNAVEVPEPGISYESLVKIVLETIRRTNTCDKHGTFVFIDPGGLYIVPTNKALNIQKLPVGTRLMWDSTVKETTGSSKRILHPAIITQRHWILPVVKVKLPGSSNWMGPTSEYLRFPTDMELKIHPLLID